jgi:hypothetical protein
MIFSSGQQYALTSPFLVITKNLPKTRSILSSETLKYCSFVHTCL